MSGWRGVYFGFGVLVGTRKMTHKHFFYMFRHEHFYIFHEKWCNEQKSCFFFIIKTFLAYKRILDGLKWPLDPLEL